MRSRYAAFVRREVEYLAATDKLGKVEEYRQASPALRYLDLAILAASVDGDLGEVLFHARIFERGQDRSFVELSEFVREDGRWKYTSGRLVPTAALPADPRTLTRDDVIRLSERTR
jgi:SEC-C motif-containing protein